MRASVRSAGAFVSKRYIRRSCGTAACTDPWLRTRAGEHVHFAKVISRCQQGAVM